MTYCSALNMRTSKVKNHAIHLEQDNTTYVHNKVTRVFTGQKKSRKYPGYQTIFNSLLRFILHLKMLFKFLAELINPSCSIDQFDLAGVKRMGCI